MTCREKLALEHPESIGLSFEGGCQGCPHQYGYLPKPKNCAHMFCRECWDREIPVAEKTKNGIPWGLIKEIVDEGMAKRDREIHLYFNPDTGWSIDVYPWPESAFIRTEG